MSKSKAEYRVERLVSVDFDGVLHEHPSYVVKFGEVQVDLIRALHKAGHPVAVSTCNDVWRVADVLEAAGFEVYADRHHRYTFWSGGKDGREVLVTNCKVAAMAYIDDRAVNWKFGDLVSDAVKACRIPSGAARCLRCGAQAYWATSMDRPQSRQAILDHNEGCDAA